MTGKSDYGFYSTQDFHLRKLYSNFIQKDELFCIDGDYEIYGDYNAPVSSALMVVFKRCDAKERDYCSNDKDFKEALVNSFLVIYDNQEIFNHQEIAFSDESIIRETKISWIPLTP